jgi:hypothetical protein
MHMRRASLSQMLAAALAAGMLCLLISSVLLGIAIEQDTIAPPQLDVQLGGWQVMGYVTHMPDCDQYVTPCPSELIVSPPQDDYVIWVLAGTIPLGSAGEGLTTRRLLMLPLQDEFDRSPERVTP